MTVIRGDAREAHPTHRWGQLLGGVQIIVNGQRRHVPLICVACLCMENSHWAERPCDRPEKRAETVHACPSGDSGTMPCCGRTPFEVPTTDRMTQSSDAVTCVQIGTEP